MVASSTLELKLKKFLFPGLLVFRLHQRKEIPPVGAHDTPYAILVVPLLVESANYRERVDRVLVIDCAVETQIARVMARSALRRDEVLQILATQATREKRLATADDVISNDGTQEQLGQQVVALDLAYRANRGSFPTKD